MPGKSPGRPAAPASATLGSTSRVEGAARGLHAAPLAMQKVEGSNPFSRFEESPAPAGLSVFWVRPDARSRVSRQRSPRFVRLLLYIVGDQRSGDRCRTCGSGADQRLPGEATRPGISSFHETASDPPQLCQCRRHARPCVRHERWGIGGASLSDHLDQADQPEGTQEAEGKARAEGRCRSHGARRGQEERPDSRLYCHCPRDSRRAGTTPCSQRTRRPPAKLWRR